MKLNVALPSITNKLEIAFTNVSTVEMVKANPSVIIINDNNSVCSFSNSEKKPRSGLALGSIENETIPANPIKKTIGTIIKKEMIKPFFKVW